jgi:succinoglycan biosynthesis transport protein ExoP
MYTKGRLRVVRAQGTASRTAALNAALRRGLLLTILLAIAGGIAGGLVGERMSTVSTATATILVNPLDGNPFSTKGSGDDLINLETEAQLVPSDDVTSMVREEEPTTDTLDAIRSGLTVDVPANTQILEITYSSSSAAESLARAQLFADQYLLYRENRAKELVANQTRRLEEQITARRKEQETLAKSVNAAPAGSTQASVQRVQLEAVSTQINQLRARSAELQSTSSNPGQIVTPAAIPPTGLLGSWVAFALAGAFAGLMLAVGIALLRSRADNRIRHVDDISTAGQVLLAEVPAHDVVTSQQILSAGVSAQASLLPDSFKSLRVSLLTTEHRRPAVIVITTASTGDAPPVVTAGLALATATSNLRTVVIEAVGSQLTSGDETDGGLAGVLDGRTTLEQSLIQVRPHLQVLPGGDPVGVDDLFMAPQMRVLISDLQQSADLIFLVTSNVHDPRSKALVDLADAVILEAVQGVSSYRDLYRASTDYSLVAEKLLGVVYVSNVTTRGKGTGVPPDLSQPDWDADEATTVDHRPVGAVDGDTGDGDTGDSDSDENIHETEAQDGSALDTDAMPSADHGTPESDQIERAGDSQPVPDRVDPAGTAHADSNDAEDHDVEDPHTIVDDAVTVAAHGHR